MGKVVKVNIFKNKANGQMKFDLPKRKIGKRLSEKLYNSKRARISIEELYDT